MVAHSSDRIHEAIRLIFSEACDSPTPLSVVGRRCADLRSDPEWKGADVDKVGDAVLRLLSMHLRAHEQHREAPSKAAENHRR